MTATLEENEEVTFTLANGVLRALKEIATLKRCSLEDALAYAVASGRVIVKETSEGARVVIRKDDAADRKLVVGE